MVALASEYVVGTVKKAVMNKDKVLGVVFIVSECR